jgi:hypothetical protein
MAKNQVEKQNLPWEARLFDPERDIKDGKIFVLDNWEIVIEAGKTSIFDIELHAYKNDNPVVISKWDIMTISIEYDSMNFTISLEKVDGTKEQYLVDKDFFQTLRNYHIRVIKPRNLWKIQNQAFKVQETISDILSKIQPGFQFKVKSDIAETLPTSLHWIKKWATIIVDSQKWDTIWIKVFHNGVEVSKKWVLKSDFGELQLSKDQFEMLFWNEDVTNLRKRAITLLELK